MKKFFALLAVLVMLTGCSGATDRNNIMNLLSSPKLSERESRIITAINNYLGTDVVLKYPKRGGLSPVQIADLDNDNRDEAVVLYTEPTAGSYVRMAVLEQGLEGWNVSYDTEGFGTEIYRINFENLTKKDSKEIVVSYTFGDSSEKILSVYFIDDGGLDYQHTFTCQDYMLHDITGDDAADIVLAGINADNQRTQLKVLSTHYNNSFLTALSTRQINVRNATVNNIAFSKSELSGDKNIIIDYRDTSGRIYTEAMYFDGYNLNQVMGPDVVQKIWYFGYELNSRDVDGDGYYETPTIIDDGSDYSFNLKQMEWTSFLQENPQRKFYGVCEAVNGVFFPLPDEWQNNITLVAGETKDSWRVVQTSTGDTIVSFSIVTAQNSAGDSDNEEIVVGKGTLQVKIVFDGRVTPEQRTYIANGLMDIR